MRSRVRSAEDGFTLIELLVVLLIIGILAAIALPTFLNQERKGQDASAKSDARNMVSEVESCFADKRDYSLCHTGAQLGTTGLDIGTGVGQVQVTDPPSGSNTDGYQVDAHSKSGSHFYMSKVSGGPVTRTCTVAGEGGCHTGGVW